MRRLSPWTALWLAVALCGWGWYRLGQAAEQTQTARDRYQALDRDLQRLASLREQVQAPVAGRRPQDDLVTQAQDALVAAGLPITAFSGVQPRADQTANGLRIQTVQLRLRELPPGGFGAWLAAWDGPDQAWRVSELQMVHSRTAGAGAAAAGNRFDIILTLIAPYLENGP